MMDKEELFSLYRDNVKITARVEKILRPKRYYKRPDLQRLSNRWYGMVATGFFELDIHARPSKDSIRIPMLDTDVFIQDYLDTPMEKSVKVVTEEYKLKTLGYRFRCPEELYTTSLSMALDLFWNDARKMEFAQKV